MKGSHLNMQLFVMVAGLLYSATAFAEGITEEQIPAPAARYELPPEMVGDFVVPAMYDNIELSVYTSDKYIVRVESPDHSSFGYGHVVREGTDYVLVPLRPRVFEGPTRITTTSAGLSLQSPSGEVLLALRKTRVVIGPVAEGVSISRREARERYFVVTTRERGEFALSTTGTRFTGRYYLTIDRGQVVIGVALKDGAVAWKGLLEVAEQSETSTTGLVHFTGGAAYSDVLDGIASIQIAPERITVRFRCTSAVEAGVREVVPDLQSPLYQVFEF